MCEGNLLLQLNSLSEFISLSPALEIMNESVYMKRCLFKLQSVIVTLPGPRKSLATLWEDVVRSSKVSCASVRSGSWGGSVTSVCRATTTLTETTHWAVKVTSF